MNIGELRCQVFPAGTLPDKKYVVVCSRFGSQWVLSRHKARQTWELQGGHIEAGETTLEAARRELYEESGIAKADLYPLCDYVGYDDAGSANGEVYLAVVHELGTLPESEMAETTLCQSIQAEQLTYPLAAPVFIDLASEYLRKHFPDT